MEYIILIILTSIALIICAFIPSTNDEQHVIKFIALMLVLFFFAWSVCTVSYDYGVKDGAFNQLRGKYEVTYVINKDSCVVDTIINLD